MHEIRQWFPMLSEEMWQQLAIAEQTWKTWNQNVNVVSRKDIELLHLHHIAHSLSILHYTPFPAGTRVLDLGTGGGFPGIPLAIASPEAHFTLADSIGKKIMVVQEVVSAVGLKNVHPMHARAESLSGPFDVVITRAVAPAAALVGWTSKLFPTMRRTGIPYGILTLKGGVLHEELKSIPRPAKLVAIEPLQQWMPHPFFDQKFLVHIAPKG